MLIGLTGSIAAGKSTVARELARLGAYVLDADAVSREAVSPKSEGLRLLVEAFGADILNEDGTLARKRMAERVFADEEARARMDTILHPLIVGQMEREARAWLAAHPAGVAVWDMPLLIECGAWERADSVWLVTAPDALRLARILARDGCTREHALARMASQMPQAEKARYADVIIENKGDLPALKAEVESQYRALFLAQNGG